MYRRREEAEKAAERTEKVDKGTEVDEELEGFGREMEVEKAEVFTVPHFVRPESGGQGTGKWPENCNFRWWKLLQIFRPLSSDHSGDCPPDNAVQRNFRWNFRWTSIGIVRWPSTGQAPNKITIFVQSAG